MSNIHALFFKRGSKHLEACLRHCAFNCFSVFETPDENNTLAFDPLQKHAINASTKQSLYCLNYRLSRLMFQHVENNIYFIDRVPFF